MKPVQLLAYAHTGFIKMSQLCSKDIRSDLLLDYLKGVVHASVSVHYCALVEGAAPQIAHELFDFLQRQLIVVVQKNAERLDSGAALNRLTHFLGESTVERLTATGDHTKLMFGDFHTRLRYIKNLSFLNNRCDISSTKFIVAAGAGYCMMHDYSIRLLNHTKCGARMTLLATRFFSSCFGQARLFAQAIR